VHIHGIGSSAINVEMKNNETLIVDGKELQIWIKKIYLCKYIHVAKDLIRHIE
jgi:hypothetical protein